MVEFGILGQYVTRVLDRAALLDIRRPCIPTTTRSSPDWYVYRGQVTQRIGLKKRLAGRLRFSDISANSSFRKEKALTERAFAKLVARARFELATFGL